MFKNYLLIAVWLFLPMGAANIAPVLFKNYFLWLAKPVSVNWFGSHKTWRGLITATLLGGIFGACYAAQINYPLWFGFPLAAGAILGDLIKSFFKRRIKIAPGKSWVPFDQVDYVFGGIILGGIFFPELFQVPGMIIVFIGLIMHPLVNWLGYILKIKPNKW